ncbi:MAG: hypothetical protein ACR2NZ_25245, partial [Rubripirellula sp.]
MEAESTHAAAEPWLFPRVWGAFLLVLVVLTYPLWFLPSSESAYPNIALFTPMLQTGLLGIVPSITLLLSLLAVVALPKQGRWAWWMVAASLLGLFLLDQHRLQPWAYQSCIYALIFATMDERDAKRFLIPLAATVYIFSAAGKIDYQFAHTVGQDFLQAIAIPLGGIPAGFDEALRTKLALLFPSVELIAGIGLLIPTTRRVAAFVLIAMHV